MRALIAGLLICLAPVLPAQSLALPDPAEVAGKYLSSEEQPRAETEALIETAPPEYLRQLLLEVRRIAAGQEQPPAVREPGPQVEVDTRVLVAPARALRTLLEAGGRGQKPAQALSEQEAQALLQAAREDPEVSVLAVPMVATPAGQVATVSILEQIAYVQDYEVQVGPEGTLADPIIGTVQDGFVLELEPGLVPGSDEVDLRVDITVSDLTRPIETRTTSLGAGAPVAIQLPVMVVRHVVSRVRVPDDGWGLLGGLPPRKDGVALALLTRVHVRGSRPAEEQ